MNEEREPDGALVTDDESIAVPGRLEAIWIKPGSPASPATALLKLATL